MDKDAGICGDEDETLPNGQVNNDKDGCGTVQGEGVINRTGKMLAGSGGGRAVFNDAGLNGFAHGDNVDLVLGFWFNGVVMFCFNSCFHFK